MQAKRMFPLKVQRGAVRRGIGAPQAAPGLPKAGGAAGKKGGRRQASAGRRRRRPPAQQEAAEGWGAPGASPASERCDHGRRPGLFQASGKLQRWAAKRSSVKKPRSRRVALSHQPPPTSPAAPPRWVPGCARRRS